MDLICSVKECSKPIVGVGVLLSDDEQKGWEDDGSIEFYYGDQDGDRTQYAIVHPTCFVDIFHELLRQESNTTFFIAISKTGDMREALQIP